MGFLTRLEQRKEGELRNSGLTSKVPARVPLTVSLFTCTKGQTREKPEVEKDPNKSNGIQLM